MNTSSFIFPKLLRPLQSIFGMPEEPNPTTRTKTTATLPSRKRKLGECTSPIHDSNKRLAASPDDEEDVVFISSVQTTPEPDLDYMNRPRPGEDWNDNIWRSETVGKLVAGSTDILSLFPKAQKPSRSYRIHNELLCFYSPYYRSLILTPSNSNGGRIPISSGGDGKLRRSFWAETTQSALSIFLKWLYTRSLTNSKGQYDWVALVDLYIWAHSTSILALKRDIMTALQNDHTSSADKDEHWFFSYAIIAKIYTFLPSSSPLRAFIVSTYIQHWAPGADDKEVRRQRAQEAPSEFLFAVMEGKACLVRDGGDTEASFVGIEDENGNDEDDDDEDDYGVGVGGDGSDGECEGHRDGRRVWCCGGACQFHEHKSEGERAATCGLPYRESVEDAAGRKARHLDDTDNEEDER